MNIGIIGAGNIGKALGRALSAAGHSIKYGVRDPAATKLADIKVFASVSEPRDAVALSEIVVLSVPWAAAKDVIDSVDMAGKIVIDTTNAYIVDDKGVRAATSPSAGEQIQAWLPRSKVVKAFNQTGFNNIESPQYDGRAMVMLVAGNDPQAVEITRRLAESIGFDARAAGGIGASVHLENLALLWIHLAYVAGMGRDIAFSLSKN